MRRAISLDVGPLPGAFKMHGQLSLRMPEPRSKTVPATTVAPPPALTLRICGTPQDGRLVRLAGGKCTIGSDSQCTLRLRAPGVDPIHCLVLRGPDRTIVRRWSGETQLNGRELTTAMLEVGDRLTIGTVEFEVVDGVRIEKPANSPNSLAGTTALAQETAQVSLNTIPAAALAGDDRAAARRGRARARRLVTRLREVYRENELNALRLTRLEEAHRKLQQEIATNARQPTCSEERNDATQPGGPDHASIERQRVELEKLRVQLEDDRGALQNDRAAFVQAWAALEQDRAAVESQRLLVQQELRTFQEHKHALTLERLDWQTETSRAEAEILARRDELERRAAALEKQHLDQEPARRQLELAQRDVDQRQEALQQAENNLGERKRQVEAERLTVDDDRRALQQERVRLEADRQALANEKAALTSQRQALEELRQQSQGNDDEWSRRFAEQARQLSEATERLNRATRELQQQQALLEAARRELDDERRQWDAQREQLRHDHEQQLASLRAEQPAADGPKKKEEIFSRLRSMSLLKVDGADDQSDETSEGQQAPPENSDVDDLDGRQPWAEDEYARPNEWSDTPSKPQQQPVLARPKHKDEDEESIDNYMAQLMKRLRGVGSGNQAPAHQAPECSVRSEQTTPAMSPPPSSQPVATVQEVPARLMRRALAAELSSDLAAMRELANLSARAAIDKHTYRNWGRAAFGKLTIALLAVGTGAGAVYFAPAPDSMLMYAGLSSFVVALFWLLQAGTLMNHVIRASRRNDVSLDTSNDDPDVAAMDPSPITEEDEFAPAELIPAHDSYKFAADGTTAEQPNDDDEIAAYADTQAGCETDAPACSYGADDSQISVSDNKQTADGATVE